ARGVEVGEADGDAADDVVEQASVAAGAWLEGSGDGGLGAVVGLFSFHAERRAARWHLAVLDPDLVDDPLLEQFTQRQGSRRRRRIGKPVEVGELRREERRRVELAGRRRR